MEISRGTEQASVETAYLGRGWEFPPRWTGLLQEEDQGDRDDDLAGKNDCDAWVQMQSNLARFGNPTGRKDAKNEDKPLDQYSVEMSDSLDDIRQAVHIILGTRRGERVMHPDFGSNLHLYVFESINPRTLNLIGTEIKEALTMWERRIREIEVHVKASSEHLGRVDAEISFVVDTHRMRQSLIYPFYVQHPEDK